MSAFNRHTLASAAVCAGIGLHSGEHVRMVLKPAAPGAGIVFERSDITGHDNRIEARAANVTGIRLGTTIANEAGASVATVEHLMAALAGLGVDDLLVEIDGPEVPVMDGSSAPFVELIRRAGLKASAAPRRAIRVLKSVSVEFQGRTAAFLPSLKPVIDVEISFPHPAVGRQHCAFDISPEIFAGDVASARTFGFKRDVDAMRAAGLALGGSMDNAVVLDDSGVINEEGLRFADEFARHKALDALGDLYLAGAPILGLYQAHQPGHALNNAALKALLADTSAWKMVSLSDAVSSPSAAARS
ncbi:UDP-3-O-acyl-N-acetylglucosamine deacetylase [Hyphobacterium marinum]|uniref:UDP-3-O-acyl-N-acetylglucosamine deacetylase n=1 Tax=Hyphobacterium marinum TaxID=3116574 RepID=A0ABU7LX03_9PROT|nr:UDP-3-O-acyl-N-acetylglucosamine deacetylase [Hyphobacterium sp. Y6023]MEE2566045.1 UDP-3-O-acyl-N-acetylglucosamine deacetylase [Hyphobacterium sp. Y6023]